MNGPCLCGDYMCPSCGPAQGYNPKYEMLREKIVGRMPAFLEGILDASQQEAVLEAIIDAVGEQLEKQELLADEEYARQLKEEERLANEYFS